MTATRTYLDWNATAQVYPEVVDIMSETLIEGGNASSVHQEGRNAHNRIEAAREQVAGLVNATPQDVIFTSGGSEANALALSGLAGNGSINRILYSEVEHPSILASVNLTGISACPLPVDGNGGVDLQALETELKKAATAGEAALVSVMWANNETGVIQPMEEIVRLAHAHKALVHCDAVQAVAKVPVDFSASGIDLMSVSAHKIGGPQGAGALVMRPSVALAAMIKGGGQELGRRAGTQNLSGIAGFGLAAELSAANNQGEELSGLQSKLESGIKNIRRDVVIFGQNSKRLPNTTCMAVAGTMAETLLIMLDLAGIAVSSGSACSSGKVTPSHVLTAMGVDDSLTRAAVRVSLGRTTTREDIDKFINVWSKAVGSTPDRKATAAA